MEVRAEAAQVDRLVELALEGGPARLDGDEQRVGQVGHQREVADEVDRAAEVVAQRPGNAGSSQAKVCPSGAVTTGSGGASGSRSAPGACG